MSGYLARLPPGERYAGRVVLDLFGGDGYAAQLWAGSAPSAWLERFAPLSSAYDAGQPCKQGETAASTGCIPATPEDIGEDPKVFRRKIDPQLSAIRGPNELSEDHADYVFEHFGKLGLERLRNYTRGSDQKLNGLLRHNRPLDGKMEEVFEVLQAAAGRELPEPVTVWRGVGALDDGFDAAGKLVRQAKEIAGTDEPLRLTGMVSTSGDPETALEFAARAQAEERNPVVFRIRAKRGLYLDANSDLTEFPGEYELIQRHESEYNVKSVTSMALSKELGLDNVTVIDLEEI